MANEISMPAFGGLMRYKEEYNSKLKFGPGVVVALIILVIAFVAGLYIFWGDKLTAATQLIPLAFLKNVWRNKSF